MTRPMLSRSTFRNACARAYLGLFGVVSLFYVVAFARRHAPWPLGDWLINYQGGFVRRGLPGQLILLLARVFHVPLIAVAAGLEAACVLCIVFCLWPLVGRLLRTGSPLWQKALLLSPATLAFIWLDPGLALRKEIALFAGLGILIWVLRRKPAISDFWLSAILALACPVLLLSHEGLACYMPYTFAVVALGRRSVARAVRIFVVPATLSLMAVAAAMLHPGNPAISARICASVGGPASGMCTGPIAYLGLSRADYAGEVINLMHDRRMLLTLGITAGLALLPVIAGLVDLWRNPVSRNTRAVLPAAFVVAALGSVELFLQAQDWSRWIYIHIMCLLLTLMFALDQRDGSMPHTEPPAASEWRARPLWAAGTVLILVVYATAWHLPEWILQGYREYRPYGYGPLLLRLERHVGSPKRGVGAAHVRMQSIVLPEGRSLRATKRHTPGRMGFIAGIFCRQENDPG